MKKVGEEATETIVAAKNADGTLVPETADLIYHVLVLLAERGIGLEDLMRELRTRRTGAKGK